MRTGCMLVFLAALSPACAQTPAPTEPPKTDSTLGDRLDKSNGVIAPKQNLDPDMRRQPPRVNDQEMVVPPPTQGDPKTQPK